MSSSLYAKKFTFDKSSSTKESIYQNLVNNSKGNAVSFIFHYHPSIAASEAQSLTTLLSTKTQSQQHQHPCPILLQLHHSSLPFCKNHKQTLRLSMQDTYIYWGLCIFLMRMLKTGSISFINCELVRTLHLVVLLSNL